MSRESGDRERGESVRARRAEQMRARAAGAEQARGLQRVSQIEPVCRKTRFSRDDGVLRTQQFYLTQPQLVHVSKKRMRSRRVFTEYAPA